MRLHEHMKKKGNNITSKYQQRFCSCCFEMKRSNNVALTPPTIGGQLNHEKIPNKGAEMVKRLQIFLWNKVKISSPNQLFSNIIEICTFFETVQALKQRLSHQAAGVSSPLIWPAISFTLSSIRLEMITRRTLIRRKWGHLCVAGLCDCRRLSCEQIFLNALIFLRWLNPTFNWYAADSAIIEHLVRRCESFQTVNVRSAATRCSTSSSSSAAVLNIFCVWG